MEFQPHRSHVLQIKSSEADPSYVEDVSAMSDRNASKLLRKNTKKRQSLAVPERHLSVPD